jgi:hypothetical protein
MTIRFAAMTFLVFLAGCKTVQPQSKIKHTLGAVSWSDGPWTYLDLDRDTFIKMNNSSYLPETHQLSIKSKEWVDRLHTAVVGKYPQKMKGIPHPQIIVMKKASADAFAAKRRNVSYQMKIKISSVNEPSLESRETSALYFNESNKKLAHNIFPPEIRLPVTDPAGYSVWFSKIHPPCTIEKLGRSDVEWAYGPECNLESYLKPSAWSPEFVTQAAPNWLIVTSGLFTILPTEESFAAILAHELAHYYRAHVVKDMKHYNHCYLLNDPEHKPVAREELQNLCRDLKVGRSRGGMDPATAAANVGLGVYTVEEEADELALEILSLAGIDPLKATEAWFALFEHADANVTETEIPFARCRELFKNNWRDHAGNPVAVPVGDYEDTHHSWCFRVFNTTNEIAIHNYHVERPLGLDAQEWQKFRMLGGSP